MGNLQPEVSWEECVPSSVILLSTLFPPSQPLQGSLLVSSVFLLVLKGQPRAVLQWLPNVNKHQTQPEGLFNQ